MSHSAWTRTRLRAALGGLALLTAACSGPAGVELGQDWEGATTFVLARVDGLVTVVGVDPDRARAESLAVVPQQPDDTDGVSPHIVRLADGRWIVTVPREGGGPDRRYAVNRAEHTLDGLAGDERLRRVLPGRTLVAEVAGLPDTGTPGRAPSTSVLVRDPSDWSTRRELTIPGTIGLAASDPGSDTVCLGTDTEVVVAELGDGEVRSAAVPGGAEAAGLACPDGHPVIVRSSASGGGSAAVGTTLTRTSAATTVRVAGGRVDGVEATGSSIVIAAAAGDDTWLIEIDAHTGSERHRVRIEGMTASLALAPSPAGWLVYTEDSVTRVDLESGRTEGFPLPGTWLDS
ncbi:hypothetical protein ABZ614_28845 [Streptomyces sp. NPDC013178]|uniref:hypothetical protein n=1 Tax=unclassified Streptomyces TaxID=2593676 RepID=UPI0033CB0C67